MNSVKTFQDQRAQTVADIEASGAVAIIRMAETDKVIRVVEALREGGLTAIEITMTVPGAVELIAEVAARLGTDIQLGVGSVLEEATLHAALDAGATYVVSPVFKPSLVAAGHARGAPVMPGAFTPTEIQAAYEAGADVIKVFPANIVGMAFFKAVLAPMPHLPLMPTGGVTLTNAGDWLAVGARAVGVGSALLDKQAIAESRYGVLTENARTIRRSIEAYRNR